MGYGSSGMSATPPKKKAPAKKASAAKPPSVPRAPKKRGSLTKRQEETLKKHSVHHTKKHMDMMRKLMREGKTFTEAHKMTMKKIGK